MTEPIIFGTARDLIRAGKCTEAVDGLMAAIAELPAEFIATAYSYAGLAFYFAAKWPEAMSMFTVAANGSEVPEDWFNLAMAQVKLGDVPAAHASWQKTFDLSYAHQDAPETSTFFMKKLLFAQALADAGAYGPVGLDLLERQLLPFFTNHRVTDSSFWGLRGVPDYCAVMDLLLKYYRALGKTKDDWTALCDRVKPQVDSDGQAYADELIGKWETP